MVTKLELQRQSIHALLGILIVALFYFDIINYFILGIISISVMGLSYLTKKGYKIFLFGYLLNILERNSEKEYIRAKGLIFYLIGSTLAMLFFPKNIAIASILILAIGDSISTFVGPYGNIKHPFSNHRFIEGIIIGSIAATLAAMFFVPFISALGASIIGMFVEAINLKINNFEIDDNLIIPLVSGLIMLLISIFLII